jgi:hypothetical protein
MSTWNDWFEDMPEGAAITTDLAPEPTLYGPEMLDFCPDYAPVELMRVGSIFVRRDSVYSVDGELVRPEPVAPAPRLAVAPRVKLDRPAPVSGGTVKGLPDLWHSPDGQFDLRKMNGGEFWLLTWLTPGGKPRKTKGQKHAPKELAPFAARIVMERYAEAPRLQWAVRPLQWLADKATKSRRGYFEGRLSPRMLRKIQNADLPLEVPGEYRLDVIEPASQTDDGPHKDLIQFTVAVS